MDRKSQPVVLAISNIESARARIRAFDEDIKRATAKLQEAKKEEEEWLTVLKLLGHDVI